MTSNSEGEGLSYASSGVDIGLEGRAVRALLGGMKEGVGAFGAGRMRVAGERGAAVDNGG
eukprot:CAMPEP_0184684518 /NCGR_PEP_ID=MMETSP0312-20130426/15602_1 /TAXON_ID=31354 /ORGANISM="Compsopogon coeruleus, Strain SAG 36.94" /LENGTH=59 /DNA_ID=CAMNT_0027137759 /DNA_START=125 /DNA_END=300 /DNA_ORIENTATION=+